MKSGVYIFAVFYLSFFISGPLAFSWINGEVTEVSEKIENTMNPNCIERMVGYGEEGQIQVIKDSTSESSFRPPAARTTGSVGVNTLIENPPLMRTVAPLDFSDLTLVESPEDWPYRANVRLEISFPSENQRSACSGVLIDPKHVLTAGHCVWGGAEGEWAESIKIVPAYELMNGPWGHALARSSGLYSWDGWVYDQNTDDDVGLIYFERPIGAITGWFNYGYNNDPFFYTDNIFYNPGYPSEEPYDGEHMYTWSGKFDGTESFFGLWYGKEVWIDSAPVQGQSGSGAYYYAQEDRTVYAVYTNSSLFRGNYARITPVKYDHIRDQIRSHTPSNPDLIPLNVRTTPHTIHAGEQLSSMNYLIHNYSSAAWEGTIDVDVYLSPDREITTEDTIISTHAMTGSIFPKESELINLSVPPIIPATTPVTRFNQYWIGVILKVSDYDTANNVMNESDVSLIEVEGPLETKTTTTSISIITTTIPIIKTTTTTINDDCPQELIYGTHSEDTELLRCFRDEVLSKTAEGQEIIKLYYQWSPVIVRLMEQDKEFKKEVKKMIDEILPLIEGRD